MKKLIFLILVVNTLSNTFAQTTSLQASGTKDFNSIYKPVKWRNIGPFRGGRSVASSGVINDITTYYMGTTGGGLWKTDDIGLTWTNISDGFFKTGSVGAVAVSEYDPNIIYVGMGEHAPRGVKTHHGDGVYKSTDAGKSWKHMGLELTQHISRVIIHPKNPDIVYVAAQGALYSPHAERGIYKSTDGGKSWSKTLYVNDKTGCVELSMDMNNPLILYAAMWEHGRLPWKVISGGAGSGLYKSVDGGNTWEKINNGLPNELGKMAIAVSRSNSEKVYALVESDSDAEKGGLFVSTNAGKNWNRVTNDHRLIQRAWYYIELFIDPKNENTIYVLSAPCLKSIDGGKTWSNISGTHGDYHDLWIDPTNPKRLVISNDGGAAISFNGGKTWTPQNNLPTAQFYRINVDNLFPYNIYAGQQDNSSVKIAHRDVGGGITASSWTYSAGGESAFLAFDPDDPRYVLGGSYQGTIEVLDNKAKAGTNIMAAPIQYLGMDAKDMKYRFNWNAPIIWSKHEPNTFYHGAQKLLKTSDMGKTWSEASPDLTRNEKEKQGKGGGPYTNEAVGAENYGTLAYVMESPHEKGVIYTGSDDGYIFVTRDNGKNWTNITPKDLKECLINAIEVSPHDKATVYIATTRYKFNDHTPNILKSTDYGKTWTAINSGIAPNAFTRVVREDDIRKDLLYAGTELGVYISYNGGKNWSAFNLNLPITPITDLRVHKSDLIAATSGRSFWILDDLGLIRQYKESLDSFSVFTPEDPILINASSELNGTSDEFKGTNKLRGVNPASGLVIYYTLPTLKESEHITMNIKDEKGMVIRSFTSKPDPKAESWAGGPDEDPVLSKNKGMNRFVWDLRYPTMAGIKGTYIESSFSGHKASPGKYTIDIIKDKSTISTQASILPNPLYPYDKEVYSEYHEFMYGMEKSVDKMHKLVNSLHEKRQQLESINDKITDEKQASLKKEINELITKMKAWDEDMIQRKSKAYDDVENFPNKFTANYLFLLNQTESDIPRVNQPSKDLLKEYTAQWEKLEARAKTIESELIAINKKLWDAGLGAIWK